jgi:sialidase-1
MTVRISHDEGRSWETRKIFHEGQSAYTYLVVLPNGESGCLSEAEEKIPHEVTVFVKLSDDESEP